LIDKSAEHRRSACCCGANERDQADQPPDGEEEVEKAQRGQRTHEPRQEADQLFATPDYIKMIQRDTTQFRVLKFINGQPIYENSLAYWNLYSAYGYHGAKPRIYQDMVDVAGIGNPLVWQLMNVKYIFTNKPDSSNMFLFADVK